MQPEQRRAAILDAAVAEITERGFARTASRHVAARAGVTHGLLHHYFPHHDSLLAAAFERGALEEMDEVRDTLASDRDPLAQLRLGADDYAWVTRELLAVAETCAKGRAISCLEGGYDLEALAESAAAHVREMMKAA